MLVGSGPAASSLGSSGSSGPLEIVTPGSGSTLGNGNLVLVEATTATPLDGTTGWVEVLTGNSKDWVPARQVSGAPTRWRYIWSDPEPGPQRVRVRAVGLPPGGVVERTSIFNIDPSMQTGMEIDNPYAAAGRFCKGQLHVHSTHSFDGWTSMPPMQLAEEYQRLGYHFLVITDHNVIAYPKEAINDSFVVIPGYESTADSGHITGMFVEQVADPILSAQERIDAINSAGGMAILNHPSWRVGWEGTDLKRLRNYTGIEIYNTLTASQGTQRRNIAKWHEVLNANGRLRPVWGVAVDDAHDARVMNTGWVMAKMPSITANAVGRALQTGSFYSTNGPSFSTIGVLDGAITAASSNANVIRFIDEDMNVVHEAPPALATYRPSIHDRFIRVEAMTTDGATAWSQPFWILE